RVGHLARDCRSTTNANTANNQRGTRAGQKPTCFECGTHGHFKRECPKLKQKPCTGTLSIGPVQNERIIRPTEGAIQQRLYKAYFLTLGSSGLVFQEEGWIISNVHRLSRTKQANGKESLSTPYSQMHNNIMVAGSRDRPPMLAPGRYPQWRSRFLRYVDTRLNGEALRKCILSCPYKPTTVLVHAVEATDNSPAVSEHTTVETPSNMSLENKAHFLAEKEVIHLILIGIGNDIYSTVDAFQTAQEMWEAIERLQQGESLNIQDVKTNLFWEFGKFTSHDGETMESYYTRLYKIMNEMIRINLTMTTMQVNVQFLQQLQPEWSRFVTIVKQQHKLDEVSYQKLFDILKQYQNKVNELLAEKLARNANPLALVATAQASQDQYYQSSRSHRSSAPSPKPSIPPRSHTTTRHKGKEIAKPITPLYETPSEEENRGTMICKRIWLSLLSTSRKSTNLPTTTTSEHPQTPRTRMWIRLYEQYDWLADTDEEIDEQELEAHYSYMAKIQEVLNADSGTDSEPVEQNEQNDVESDDERVVLANLKLDVNENKKIQKQLKKENTTLAQELKECKIILAETSKSLGESISI
nr:hypothetical protein [Tanacetum cinerariifolium]